MKWFWIDPSKNCKKTYDDLIVAINRNSVCKKYIHTDDTFKLWVDILTALVHDVPVHVIDSGFNDQEIQNLAISDEDLLKEYQFKTTRLKSFSDLNRSIQSSKENPNIIIYTSGTTGKPKKVALSLKVLTRNVKTGDDFNSHVWAFAYNPTHFAGFQVFFQAALNQNPMINIFESSAAELSEVFTSCKISHISATPTFYRKLFLSVNESFPMVQRVTLGGEQFDPALQKKIQWTFPNSKIKNIYASTEAGTLFSSDSEVFSIPGEDHHFVKISDEGELLIHQGYLGQFESDKYEDGWYKSGDMVEKISENMFRFVSRKTEMINVGGYKVNPHEVESEIRKVEGVQDVVIKSRANKVTGNILIAEIESISGYLPGDLEGRIYLALNNTLQPYKIPRIIKFVENISTTRTGKKGRL